MFLSPIMRINYFPSIFKIYPGITIKPCIWRWSPSQCATGLSIWKGAIISRSSCWGLWSKMQSWWVLVNHRGPAQNWLLPRSRNRQKLGFLPSCRSAIWSGIAWGWSCLWNLIAFCPAASGLGNIWPARASPPGWDPNRRWTRLPAQSTETAPGKISSRPPLWKWHIFRASTWRSCPLQPSGRSHAKM